MRTRPAFTLLELIIVIALLAIVATVALRSVESTDIRARQQVTLNTLEEVKRAILGDPDLRQPDGSWIPNGFVNDIGALPTEEQFETLWISSLPEIPYEGIGNWRSVDWPNEPGAASAELGVGWRGPYLTIPIGASGLTDGWGNPLRINGTAIEARGGLDGAFAGDANAEYMPVFDFADAPFTAHVTGTLSIYEDGESLFFKNAKIEIAFPAENDLHPYSYDEDSGLTKLWSFDFNTETQRVPIGLRAVRITADVERGTGGGPVVPADSDAAWIRYVRITAPETNLTFVLHVPSTASIAGNDDGGNGLALTD